MKKIIALALTLVMAMSELALVFADSGATAQKSVEISPENASVQDIKKAHPKLLIRSFSDIEKLVKTDEYTLKQYAKVKATADNVMKQSAEECTLTGYRLAKPAIDMILCYRVEKDRKYIDYLMGLLKKPRFYENVEINALSRGAELMFLAFMYDWLYDVLTVEERAHVLKCIKANLEAKRKAYETNASWTVRQMNINQIAQSCIIAAALAISDEEPQISDWFMKTTIPNLASRLGQYDIDGSFDEGPAYWIYASQYLFPAFKCLETATGQSYGMANAPGMDRTGEFYIHINGPTGMQDFRYGDTPPDRRGYGAPALLYLAEKFNNPRLGYWGKYFCSRYSDDRFANTALSILLYDPDLCSYDPSQTELDGVFHGVGEIGSMRSSWDEENALQILYKGGGSIEGHSQLEAGNFVVNALGETWVKDLGWESYNVSDMFTARLGKDNPRYKLYKNNAQGNNTFIINPQETTGQNPENFSPITESYTGTDESYAVIDLTPSYEDYVVKAHRGYRIMDGKRYAIVRDEIELKEKGDYWWFVHTDKALNIGEDRRSILMSSGDNKLLMKIVSEDENLRFMITEEKPLYFTDAHDDDGESPGFRRIAVNIPNTDKVNLTIAFIPIYNDSTLSDTENMEIEPIALWKEKHSEDAQLEGIYIDGRLIKNFRPDVASYFISEKAERVTAKAPEGTKVQILPSSEGNSTTEILVSAEGKNTVTYSLHEYGVYGNSIPGLKAKSIKSSIDQSEEYLVDMNYMTYWNAGDVGSWFEMDFGQTVPLESVLISFKNGHLRTQYFELQVSDNGANYTNIGEFMSGGFTEKVELYRFPATKGRYLRFVGQGNSTNNYNFVNEIYVFETHDAAKESLDKENGHCIERIDVMCANKKLLVGERVPYEVKFTDVNMSEHKAKDARITVFNDDDVVLIDEKKRTIIANREGKAKVRFVAETEGFVLYDDVEITVSDSHMQEITAIEDTYVEVPAPDKTHGTTQKLVVRGTLGDDYSRMALLKFDISGIKDNVQSAWICLYGNYKSDLDSPQPIGVFGISDEWEQQTVTRSTTPERGEQIGEFVFGENLDWVKIDICDYLKQKLSEGAKTISVELYQEVNVMNSNTIYSTESLYKPYIGFSIEKTPTIDEEKYTKQIISNSGSGIVIENDGTVQLSEKFLTLAVKKSVPYIRIKKNGIDATIKSSVMKNLAKGKKSLFTFNVKPVDINDYPKRIYMVLKGGSAVEVSVTKDGVFCSDFPQYGGVEISFSLDESFKTAKRIYVYYMENSGCDPKPITDFSIDKNNVITVRNNKPGIFIVKKG